MTLSELQAKISEVIPDAIIEFDGSELNQIVIYTGLTVKCRNHLSVVGSEPDEFEDPLIVPIE